MKRILFTALLLLATSSLFAQDAKFGIRLGPSFTTLGGEDGGSDDPKFRIGFHLGVYTSLTISESLSFDAGLQYANKGAKGFDGPSTSIVRNGYLDIPLLLKINSGKKFYLLAGPQPSFMISSAVVLENNGNKLTVNGSEIGDLWKGFDLAGVIGLGIELGPGFHLQTTYEHGFTNISEISEAVYNRGFKLTMGKSF
jgi:hypothetical protein